METAQPRSAAKSASSIGSSSPTRLRKDHVVILTIWTSMSFAIGKINISLDSMKKNPMI